METENRGVFLIFPELWIPCGKTPYVTESMNVKILQRNKTQLKWNYGQMKKKDIYNVAPDYQ